MFKNLKLDDVIYYLDESKIPSLKKCRVSSVARISRISLNRICVRIDVLNGDEDPSKREINLDGDQSERTQKDNFFVYLEDAKEAFKKECSERIVEIAMAIASTEQYCAEWDKEH